MASMYAVYHGPDGLARIALDVHRRATALAQGLSAGGVQVSEGFFDTIRVSAPGKARLIVDAARTRGITVWEVDSDTISLSVDETTTQETVEQVWVAFQEATGGKFPTSYSEVLEVEAIPAEMIRTSAYLEHPVFNSYHSETEMLRYIRRLSDKDIALDRSMIPLGSCTMKLNGTTEMESITWPEFAGIHPFAPLDSVNGYLTMIRQLEDWLVEVTGYDAVSLQPNAGSQGEFAGLLAIRGYHKSRGDEQRKVCLIPSSAHGTNAASAVMAGMRVVVVGCDDFGNVDMDDLKHKILENADELAALMITYPSTHGVYEATVSDICAMIHDAGGQVYVDGANLNALVGLAQPGKFGADVSHLNLHKTFCIPHGGGGPGVGPVIARAHLAPFLPNHPMDVLAGPPTGPGPISAAPFGSASILPISWAYIRLMGGAGLTHATQVAILSANYIARKLQNDFPVLYTGANGLVAHECILDLREITKISGVTVDDIAKRLMDYGFHAPTMSFPVAGTFMIEPTESEDIAELDRFIAAMKAIRAEIDQIIEGKVEVEGSALRHAPHTIEAVLDPNWDRAYSRTTGATPGAREGLISGELIGTRGKYFPTVGRVDGVHGDRNLICSCTPIAEYAE
jgi:glycine dehydrogenase